MEKIHRKDRKSLMKQVLEIKEVVAFLDAFTSSEKSEIHFLQEKLLGKLTFHRQ